MWFFVVFFFYFSGIRSASKSLNDPVLNLYLQFFATVELQAVCFLLTVGLHIVTFESMWITHTHLKRPLVDD